MSVAAIATVSHRVAQIESRIGRISPQRASFDQALRRAQQSQSPEMSETLPAPKPTPQASQIGLPVGMMGTPVLLRSDLAMPLLSSTGAWADSLPEAGRDWAAAIDKAADNAGVDPRLLAAVVWQESRFEPAAISRSGAIGLTQLMPATAEGLGVDPHDPIQNLDGGARYLAWTIREFGSLDLGLAAYNAGPGTVRNAGGIPNIPETQAYVPRVLDYYRQLGGVA